MKCILTLLLAIVSCFLQVFVCLFVCLFVLCLNHEHEETSAQYCLRAGLHIANHSPCMICYVINTVALIKVSGNIPCLSRNLWANKPCLFLVSVFSHHLVKLTASSTVFSIVTHTLTAEDLEVHHRLSQRCSHIVI